MATASVRLLSRAGARSGFTLLEMITALMVGAVMLSVATSVFSSYQERISARRAAEIFQRDLTLARAMALRVRQRVTVRFSESARTYTVSIASGRELASRRYGDDAPDLKLSAMDLRLTGDSVAFSSRGVGALSGGTLGVARFQAGKVIYEVQFNPMGASKLNAL